MRVVFGGEDFTLKDAVYLNSKYVVAALIFNYPNINCQFLCVNIR